MERPVEVKSEEMFISKIDIEEHAIKLEPGEDQLDCLPADMEGTEVKTEPFEKIFIPEINIEEHAVKLEAGDQLDLLPHNPDGSNSHQVEEKRKLKSLQCDQCGIKYAHPEMLAWHIKNCHGTDAIVKIVKISDKQHNFECVLCKTVCKELNYILQHLQSQHKISNLPFQCKVCDKQFICGSYLKKHRRTCKDIVDDAQGSVKFIRKVTSYKCLHCEESFKSFPRLKSHCQNKHPSLHILQCETCKDVFVTLVGYREHKNYKHGDLVFNCNLCPATFSNPHYVKRHVTNMHSGLKKTLSCQFCSSKFKLKKHLDKHVRDKHTGPILRCMDCEYSTRRQDVFNKHIKMKHSLPKETEPCRFCNATFKCNQYLQQHIRSMHTGRILHCDSCNYNTRRKCNLVAHIKLKHFENH